MYTDGRLLRLCDFSVCYFWVDVLMIGSNQQYSNAEYEEAANVYLWRECARQLRPLPESLKHSGNSARSLVKCFAATVVTTCTRPTAICVA